MKRDKKTIMHITGVMNFGGAEVLMMNIVRKLRNRFNFVFLVHKANMQEIKGDFDDEIFALGAKIVYCNSIRSIGLKAYQKELTQLLNELKPDVVHCHLNAKCGVIAKCAHKAGIKKIISHSHAQLKPRGRLVKKVLFRAELCWQKTMINKFSTDYWGCSEEALESLFYKKARKSQKCKKISNLIDGEKFIFPNQEIVKEYIKKHNKDNKFVIGLVGRIAPVKNYIFALEVAKELKKRKVNFMMLIVGLEQDADYANKFFSTIKLYELEGCVVHLQPHKDIENIYGIMDVVLGTSISEGFSITAVEAQLSGAYTFLSNGYPKEVNLGAGNCEQINYFDANLWADKIERVMQNNICASEEARRDALIKKGFDLDVEIEKIAMEYEQ